MTDENRALAWGELWTERGVVDSGEHSVAAEARSSTRILSLYSVENCLHAHLPLNIEYLARHNGACD